MDAKHYTGDPEDVPSVAEHPAEQLFREAALKGGIARRWIGLALYELLPSSYEACESIAVKYAVQAASLYHDALRQSDECPICGTREPLLRHAGCPECEPEPIADTYDEALAKRYPRTA